MRASQVCVQRLGVELVRVDVHDRVRVRLLRSTQAADDRGGRQQPPVSAAADWENTARDASDANRQLPELGAGGQLEPARRIRDPGDPVRNPGGVVQARVEAKAQLGERLERPDRVAVDRERGGAVRDRPAATGLTDQGRGGCDVLCKGGPLLPVDALVREAVASGLVPARDDLPHEVGVAARGDAEKEERGPGVELVEKVEYAVVWRSSAESATSQPGTPAARWTSWCQSSKSMLSSNEGFVASTARLSQLFGVLGRVGKQSSRSHQWGARPLTQRVAAKVELSAAQTGGCMYRAGASARRGRAFGTAGTSAIPRRSRAP